MIGAFAYLILTTTRNRLTGKLRRLRNPRYALAVLLGLAYFWFFFFSPGTRAPQSGSPGGADVFGALFPIVILGYVAWIWIVGTDRNALAFSEAEVSMLFPAPITRRGLVVYKLVKAQAAVLTTTFLWFVVFRRGGFDAHKLLTSWVFLTTLNMHRLGVALIRASQSEHGAQGIRRHWIPIAIFSAAGAAILWGLFEGRPQLMTVLQPSDLRPVLVDMFSRPPLSWVLYPFRIAIAPALVHSRPEYLRAILAAAVLLALHVWWVLRTDSAFEEAASLASAERARRIEARRSRSAPGRAISATAARRTFRLSPTGIPAIAIVWKNMLWLSRTGQIRGLVGLPLVAFGGAVAFAGRSDSVELFVVIACSLVTVAILVLGPMTMRNDLRGELSRLPMLKTMPLSGRDIMLAEVASSASPTAAMQLLLASAAIFAASVMSRGAPPTGILVGIFLGAPVLLFGLSAANFTVHNGLALLFPGWVRLGDMGGSGVESIGQTMLTSIVTLSMLALMLVLPAILGGAAYYALRALPIMAIASAGIIGGIALTGEAWLLITALGGRLERLEPGDTT